MAPSPGGRVRRSSRTSPMRITICSSVHPTGRAPSVTSPRRENTARRAEGPRALRERLTQSQAATAPRTITDRTTQSVGLGEKLTSAYTRGVSACEPSKSMPPIRCSLPGPAGSFVPDPQAPSGRARGQRLLVASSSPSSWIAGPTLSSDSSRPHPRVARNGLHSAHPLGQKVSRTRGRFDRGRISHLRMSVVFASKEDLR
jgi:hypothetical protein